MSAFNSDRYFRFRKIVTGEVIAESRPCLKCGYDLRGLASNKNCPECGTLIASTLFRRSRDDTLGNAPLPYLLRLRIGMPLLLASPVVLALLALVGPLMRKVTPSLGLGERFVLTCLFVPAVLWATGCYFIASPRPTPHSPEGDPLQWRKRRWLLRASGLGWCVVPFCLLVLANPNLATGGQVAAQSALAVGLALGMVSAAALSHYFALLCDWAFDTEAARTFERLLWGLAAGFTMTITFLLVAGNVTVTINSFTGLIGWALGAGIWSAGVLYACWRLADLNTMTTWAYRNGQRRAAYHERQREGRTGATASQARRQP